MGIVPYIPVRVHSIQPGASKPSGFGRLVAAPTGVLGCAPFDGVRGEPALGGTMWASSPTFTLDCVPFN